MNWSFQTVQFRLRVADEVLEAETGVPREEVSAKDLLPLLRQLSDGLVQIGVKKAAEAGQSVSCGPRCGACCRQLVPVSEVETQAIAEMVAEMPDESRSEVERRFASALEKLRAAGVELDPDRIVQHAKEEKVRNGLRYFAAGVACPFLEEESCGIHPVRPVSCREYLVSNDPVHCSMPRPETVDMLPMPAKLSHALYRTSDPPRVVPLILALEWAADHPESPRKAGPEILQGILGDIGE